MSHVCDVSSQSGNSTYNEAQELNRITPMAMGAYMQPP